MYKTIFITLLIVVCILTANSYATKPRQKKRVSQGNPQQTATIYTQDPQQATKGCLVDLKVPVLYWRSNSPDSIQWCTDNPSVKYHISNFSPSQPFDTALPSFPVPADGQTYCSAWFLPKRDTSASAAGTKYTYNITMDGTNISCTDPNVIIRNQ